MPKLLFATCFDENFQPGALALVKSIRKFYSQEEAGIIALTAERPCGDQCIKQLNSLGVDVRQMNVLPSREVMLKAKAWVTMYAIQYGNASQVVHIDADAFLLAKIDSVLGSMPEDSVLAWPDLGTPGLLEFELQTRMKLPDPEDNLRFHFNAGIVCYRNGKRVERLSQMFNDAVNDPFIWAMLRNDQFILRNAVADFYERGGTFIMNPDAQHYNPIGRCADDLRLDGEKWINIRTGKQQYMWHACGSGLPWISKEKGGCGEPSIKQAFEWVQS